MMFASRVVYTILNLSHLTVRPMCGGCFPNQCGSLDSEVTATYTSIVTHRASGQCVWRTCSGTAKDKGKPRVLSRPVRSAGAYSTPARNLPLMHHIGAQLSQRST
ncbi:hypothetical protein M404DRAFT_752742 [Pisolithus tinctorius Marx 270]|uniref:Uncharacterized protein n=1 Tax=Pisolithus tinctorius Marx 270 TaxID=870435 RepID=A0A0C3IVB4_PISTI|nr:hypothetical protein M404DRAFT_752742 [Pisolithus tinctorius Marx 270]